MAKGKGKRKLGAGDVASNRYASHRYELIERIECGMVLEGTEVKALRSSGANHDPERPRKLLLHRRELDRIAARAKERGLTLVPTRIYFAGSHAKVEIALARGKD